MTIALTTLTVHVLNARGAEMFDNPRFLRVVTSGPYAGKFAVARHGKGILVTGVSRPDAVTVDSTALRVDLALTRAAKLTDIGLTPKPAKPATIAIPSDLPALVAKYEATIARTGKVFIENALTHTKDVVKREAMEIALGWRKPATASKPAAKAPKARRKPTAADVAAAIAAPSVVRPADAIDVTQLAKAIAEAGLDMASFIASIAPKKA